MKDVVHKDIDMKCPICGKPVKRVIETDNIGDNKVICENEYGVHYGNSYKKFLTPKTSPDHIRFANA